MKTINDLQAANPCLFTHSREMADAITPLVSIKDYI
jgi:hypothetical protein